MGGATDGRRASIGQYLKGLGSTLVAKKSWFCLDDTIVCLGAGISCTDGTAVESTVDNRDLGPTGSAALTVDGTVQPLSYPWSATLTGASWAHLAGHGGYVFPGRATVRAVASVTSRPATVTGATTGSSLTLTFGDLSGTGGATQETAVRLG